MKKIRRFIITIFACFVGISPVMAACDTAETNRLNGLAANVKASFEVVQVENPIGEGFNYPDGLTEEEIAEFKDYVTVFRVYITNLTEELYVTVLDQNTKEVKTYNYSDSNNGVITFDQRVITETDTYTITIYSSDKTNCQGTKLNTIYVATPMYNYYSEMNMCEGISEFYLCHEYLSIPFVSYEEFIELANRYKDGKINSNGEEIKPGDNKNDGFIGFIKEHKVAVGITSLVIIAAGGIITVIIVKKQRSRIV